MTKHTFIGASFSLRNILKNLREELTRNGLYKSTSTLFTSNEVYRVVPLGNDMVPKRNYSTKFNIFQTISQTTPYQGHVTSLKWTGSIASMHDTVQIKEAIDNLDNNHLDTVAHCESKNAPATCHCVNSSDPSCNLLSQSGGETDSFGFSLEDIIDESKQDTETLAASVVHAPQTSMQMVLHKLENESKETNVSKDVKTMLPAISKPNMLMASQERPKAQNSEQLKRAQEIFETPPPINSLPDTKPEPPKPRIYSQPDFFSPANKILPLKKIQEMANDLNSKTAMTLGNNKSKKDVASQQGKFPEKKKAPEAKKPFIYAAVEVPLAIKNIINIEENPVIMERKKRMEMIRKTVKNVNKNVDAASQPIGHSGSNKKITLLFVSKNSIDNRLTEMPIRVKPEGLRPKPPSLQLAATTSRYHPDSSALFTSNTDSSSSSQSTNVITNRSEEPEVKNTKYEVSSNPFSKSQADTSFTMNKYELGKNNDGSFSRKKLMPHFRDKMNKDGPVGVLNPTQIYKQHMSTCCKYYMMSSTLREPNENKLMVRRHEMTAMNRKLQTMWKEMVRNISNKSDISDLSVGKSDNANVPPGISSSIGDEEKVGLDNCPQSIIDAHEEYHRLMKKEIELALPAEDIGEIPPGVYQRSDGCGDGFRSIYAATAPFCSLKSESSSEGESKRTTATADESLEQLQDRGGNDDSSSEN